MGYLGVGDVRYSDKMHAILTRPQEAVNVERTGMGCRACGEIVGGGGFVRVGAPVRNFFLGSGGRITPTLRRFSSDSRAGNQAAKEMDGLFRQGNRMFTPTVL
jgi:hypothetical protein